MKVHFWGTRGSLAKPGEAYARYGGNTSCVEVRSDSGTLIVLDCGTGAHALGQKLLQDSAGAEMHGHILISHTHWDHIQGLPFFAPLFLDRNAWDIYGPKGLSESIRETLAGQMEHSYFPVTLDQLGARITYHDLVEGVFVAGDVNVRARYLNHPALTLGYRLEADGVSVVYACDHEPHSAALAAGEGGISGQDQRYLEFLERADLVIHDAQYTAREYTAKVGWGHSPYEYVVRLCREAGVKRLYLTHHDPLRDDEAVDRILADARASVKSSGSTMEIAAAMEGHSVTLAGAPASEPETTDRHFRAQTAIDPSMISSQVLLLVPDGELRSPLVEAIASEGLSAEVIADEAELAARMRQGQYSLVVLEHDPPAVDGLGIAARLRQAESGVRVPITMVTTSERRAERANPIPTDWLVKPFSMSFARTKVRAWALRSAARWVRAQQPPDEERRLGALHDLAILDTPPEARLDRLTRLAAAAFDVPIAVISLVDTERQWFKSCFGLNAHETHRDAAFCAHVVHQRSDLVVPDTLKDDRFADNPLVVEGPRIRFYAGAPLILENGSCIGTLCLIDTRPRELGQGELDTLHDLRDMAVEEIVKRRAPARRRRSARAKSRLSS